MRLFTSGALAFAIAALSPSSTLGAGQGARPKAAATGRSYVPPRTPWGDPDLQGSYTNKYEQSTPFERPDEFVGRRIGDVRGAELAGILEKRQRQVLERPAGVGPFQFRDALDVTKASRAWFLVDPPDGRIPPMTPEAERRIGPADPSVERGIQGFVNARQRTGSSFGDGPFNSPEDFGLWDRCITRGLPGSMMPHILGNSYQIVQGPGFVGIRYELIHDARLIPLDGRPHVGKGIQLEMGDARGRWEGDSLVVDTTNFKDRSAYRNANPDTLRLVERFTRTAPGRIEWAVTVDDATTWTRRWTFSIPLTTTASRCSNSRVTRATTACATFSAQPEAASTPRRRPRHSVSAGLSPRAAKSGQGGAMKPTTVTSFLGSSRMRTVAVTLVTFALGAAFAVVFLNGKDVVQGQAPPAAAGSGFQAVPNAVGSQDVTGPYEVVKGWPKDVSTMPGNEKWTYGAGESVFAESPNHVFGLFRGELPNIKPPRAVLLPQLGPNISFPVSGLWRDATTASLPGVGGTDQDTRKWLTAWEGKDADIGIKGPPYRQLGVDANWENCIVVFDANGNIIETWKQWDKILRRPHSIYISPYDPQKRVWVVDDNMQAIYIFTHDGKQLLQTIGTPEAEGADATHFNRPTYIDWLPDGTFFVSDGYTGTRVAKFDKNGKFVMQWGIKGTPPNEKRPGYMNNVHGVAVDPVNRHVFVNDRNNHRIQVFDENGKYLSEWHIDAEPSSLHLLYIGTDRNVWTFDRTTNKMVKYDQQGHLLYAWGAMGTFAGGLWGVHGMSVDQQGNLYVAEVDSGRVQKFRPKPGANPAYLVAKPVKPVWAAN